MPDDRGCDVSKAFDSKKFLGRWRKRKDREEWLFAIAIVKAGLERESNLDAAAEEELATALDELDISAEELHRYLEENRSKLLRFLDSHPE